MPQSAKLNFLESSYYNMPNLSYSAFFNASWWMAAFQTHRCNPPINKTMPANLMQKLSVAAKL